MASYMDVTQARWNWLKSLSVGDKAVAYCSQLEQFKDVSIFRVTITRAYTDYNAWYCKKDGTGLAHATYWDIYRSREDAEHEIRLGDRGRELRSLSQTADESLLLRALAALRGEA